MWIVFTDYYFVIPTLATLLVMFLVPDDDDQLFGTELNQLLETVCEDGYSCDLNSAGSSRSLMCVMSPSTTGHSISSTAKANEKRGVLAHSSKPGSVC
jgi:hypothetical protein